MYFKSDFTVILASEAQWGGCPFRIKLWTASPAEGRSIKACFDGEVWHNCRLLDDGRLLISVNQGDLGEKQYMGIGTLKIDIEFYLSNQDFNDHVCNEHVKTFEPVFEDENGEQYKLYLDNQGASTITTIGTLPAYYQAGLTPEEHQALLDATRDANAAATNADDTAEDVKSDVRDFLALEGKNIREAIELVQKTGAAVKDIGNEAKAQGELAGQKATLADQNATLAGQKAQLADQKAQLADAKANLANEKAQLADQKANLADQKAQLADQKAQLANATAQRIEEEWDTKSEEWNDQISTAVLVSSNVSLKAEKVNAELGGSVVTITNRNGQSKSVDLGANNAKVVYLNEHVEDGQQVDQSIPFLAAVDMDGVVPSCHTRYLDNAYRIDCYGHFTGREKNGLLFSIMAEGLLNAFLYVENEPILYDELFENVVTRYEHKTAAEWYAIVKDLFNEVEVVNSLTSDNTKAALSAAQGKSLDAKYKGVTDGIISDVTKLKDDSKSHEEKLTECRRDLGENAEKLSELEGKFKRESGEFDMPLEEVLKDGIPKPNGTIVTPIRWRNIIDTSGVVKVKVTQKGSVLSGGFGGYLIATYPTLEDARNNTNVIKGFTDIELGVGYVTDYEVSITAEEKYLMVLTNSSVGINVPVIKGVSEYEIEYAEKSVVDDLVENVQGIEERLTEIKIETLTNIGTSHRGIPRPSGGVQDMGRYYLVYKVEGGANCKITTKTGLSGSADYWYAIGFYATLSDAESATNPVGGVTDKDCGTANLVDFEVSIPLNVEYITVMIGSSASASAIVTESIKQPINFGEFEKKKVFNSKVLWLGTSIPEGSPYPQNACAFYGIKCYNKALGSSGIIKHSGYLGNGRDGRDLAETIAEKEARYRSKVIDGTITEATLTTWKGYGFETLMLPYIDGTIDNCDIVVFDHGYNDRGNITTELPSLATADFAVDKTDGEFDRSTYVGAFCFLVKKIWEINPNIKIFICSFYENISSPSVRSGKDVCEMQRAIANHFDFPYLDMASLNGFNYERIPNSADYISTFNARYGTSYSLVRYAGYTGNNITRQQFYCMDGLHPHTDKTGCSTEVLTQSAIKCLRDLF